MLSIPVASIGISGSLFITGKSLNINSGIGIIMLAGVVVNNAIVLFDFIEKERLKGKDLMTSIIEAGNRRLKPILMTTFTTIFALLPISLGIGEGAELQQPMAIAVIGGLSVSTLLTLVFIPTVYSMINKEKEKQDNDPAIMT
jgi:HAE1 family hydrophobic/amphiphilic exporter-1